MAPVDSSYGSPAAPVDTSYGSPVSPVEDSYSAPVAPTDSYGAPIAPSGNYGAPVAPSGNYGAPIAPSEGYGAPAPAVPPNYEAPANDPASETYGSQIISLDKDKNSGPSVNDNYSYLDFNFAAPSGDYGTPISPASQEYGAPANQPDQGYSVPVNSPTQDYGAPANQPDQGYSVPANSATQDYGAPVIQPDQGYGAPVNPPNQGYGSPTNQPDQGFDPNFANNQGGTYDPFAFQGANTPKPVDPGLSDGTTKPAVRPNNPTTNIGDTDSEFVPDNELVPQFEADVNANLIKPFVNLGSFESSRFTEGTSSPFGVSVASSFGTNPRRPATQRPTTTERPTRRSSRIPTRRPTRIPTRRPTFGSATRPPTTSRNFFNNDVLLTTPNSAFSQEVDNGLTENINVETSNNLNRRPVIQQSFSGEQPKRLTFDRNQNRFNGGSGIFFSTPSSAFVTPTNFGTPTPASNFFENEIAQSQVNAKVVPRAVPKLPSSREMDRDKDNDIITNEISDNSDEDFVRRNMLMNIILKPGAGENSKVLPRPKVEVMSQGSNVLLVKLVFPENENIHGLRAFMPANVNVQTKSPRLDDSSAVTVRESREANSNTKVLDGFVIPKDAKNVSKDHKTFTRSIDTSEQQSFERISNRIDKQEYNSKKSSKKFTKESPTEFTPKYEKIMVKSFPVASNPIIAFGKFNPVNNVQQFHANDAIANQSKSKVPGQPQVGNVPGSQQAVRKQSGENQHIDPLQGTLTVGNISSRRRESRLNSLTNFKIPNPFSGLKNNWLSGFFGKSARDS